MSLRYDINKRREKKTNEKIKKGECSMLYYKSIVHIGESVYRL